MSLRLEMLQVARLAPKLLGESNDLVRDFLLRQQNADGGFKGRSDTSDLYYTIFGIDGLLALQAELPVGRIESYLQTFRHGEELDFVHLCCLARGWAALSNSALGLDSPTGELRRSLLCRIETFRARDGGYHPVAGSPFGSAYGAFLALGCYQDLRAELPEPLCLVQALKFLETEDGAWSNERGGKGGATNATAAAITVLRNLGFPINPSAGDWLLDRCDATGGFRAGPSAPMPDLLSTATALHALAGMEISCERIKEPCLDFIDTLWTNEGSFHGHWGEELLDCEYTFYGLLALGHLSL